ncbi:cellulose biosynthesis protein BcsD [Zavarzinia aquatilis]|uniref:Cellulose synthase n=1 Tax=Zavarzinia aquatilis TaxID=2211142 RepID=A0A317E2D6_9PROT|nr:cellulose biosynthesis protein BcsD [Zavarzinia aquatilis]PWR21159.1 cellulose synthase [Zavarzinia aquatilis]
MSLFASLTTPAPVAEDGDAAYRAALLAAEALPGFFTAVADELFAVAGADNAAAFLRQVGRRMAAAMPLTGAETLQALEAAINAKLLAARWGWVQLGEVEAGIRIRHGALPLLPGPASTPGAAALLEGLYSCWLQQAGGGEHLHARRTGAGEAGCVELLYGR